MTPVLVFFGAAVVALAALVAGLQAIDSSIAYVSGGNGEDFVSGGWDSDVLSGGNGEDFLNGDAPAFGPDGDPDPNETDTCDGGNAENEVINCEA